MSDRTPIILTCCGRAIFHGRLAFAYLRVPLDWREAGIPERTAGNAVFIPDKIPGADIGDVFEIDEGLGGTILFDRRKWLDRLPKATIAAWEQLDAQAAKRAESGNLTPDEPSLYKADPETESISALRALYFALPETARAQWLERAVQQITQP